jgi:citrate lyase subunit beta/citryl-CoA lyase
LLQTEGFDAMRSFLFVPGDSLRKFESAKKTAADALILDLEDSIASDQKVVARGITRGMLDARHPDQKMYIRVNALDTGMTLGDLAAVMPGRPDGIVLPKCEGAADVNRLALYLDAFEAASNLEQGSTRIVPVATETARAVLKLFDFEGASPRLWGLMWGAEDLAASLGASGNRTASGFRRPFLLARDLCLISAAAAGVVAIDTIATDIDDLVALKQESIAARQDGFLAKVVIHPKHVDVVNAAFMPTDEEIAWSRKVVKAFDDNPDTGVVRLDGQMLDRPHLRAALKILAQGKR